MKTLFQVVLLLLIGIVSIGLWARSISRRPLVPCPWWLDWLLENRYIEESWPAARCSHSAPAWRRVWPFWTPAAGRGG